MESPECLTPEDRIRPLGTMFETSGMMTVESVTDPVNVNSDTDTSDIPVILPAMSGVPSELQPVEPPTTRLHPTSTSLFIFPSTLILGRSCLLCKELK